MGNPRSPEVLWFFTQKTTLRKSKLQPRLTKTDNKWGIWHDKEGESKYILFSWFRFIQFSQKCWVQIGAKLYVSRTGSHEISKSPLKRKQKEDSSSDCDEQNIEFKWKQLYVVSVLGMEVKDSSWQWQPSHGSQLPSLTRGVGKTLPTCGRHEKGYLRTYNCRMLLERNKRRVHLQAGAPSPTFSQGECICWFSFRTTMVDYFDRSCGRGLSSSNPYRLGSLLSTAQHLRGRKEQSNQRKGICIS